MAEQIISPGVFTRENDLSFLPQGVGQIGAGQTQANNLRVIITGTSSTQGFFADFSLIVEYDTVSVAGTITLNSGTIILNSGTITL